MPMLFVPREEVDEKFQDELDTHKMQAASSEASYPQAAGVGGLVGLGSGATIGGLAGYPKAIGKHMALGGAGGLGIGAIIGLIAALSHNSLRSKSQKQLPLYDDPEFVNKRRKTIRQEISDDYLEQQQQKAVEEMERRQYLADLISSIEDDAGTNNRSWVSA